MMRNGQEGRGNRDVDFAVARGGRRGDWNAIQVNGCTAAQESGAENLHTDKIGRGSLSSLREVRAGNSTLRKWIARSHAGNNYLTNVDRLEYGGGIGSEADQCDSARARIGHDGLVRRPINGESPGGALKP